MAANHQELLETIGSMSVLELSDFVDQFKEKFNVTALAAPVMAGPGAGAAEVAGGGADWSAGTIKVDRGLSGGWGETAAWEPNPYRLTEMIRWA